MNNRPTGLYRSDDAGATWRKVNNENPRPMYFSQVRIDPNDPDVVIYGGVGLHFSTRWRQDVHTDIAASTHDDVHAIWIDPANSNHVIIGNDGGLAVSWDQAKTWNFLPNLPVGLFYHVGVRHGDAVQHLRRHAGQLQLVRTEPCAAPPASPATTGTTVQGGDGFVALQDPTDFRVAYSESQDGNMVRVDRVTGESMSIRPSPQAPRASGRIDIDSPVTRSRRTMLPSCDSL